MNTILLSLVLAATPVSIEDQQNIELNDGVVRSVAFSPDGMVVAGCGDRFVQTFDVKTGERLQLYKGHTKAVLSLAFTPDSKQLVSSSADGTVRIWDVKTGKSIGVLVGRTRNGIGCIAVSPDGKTLISCGMPANGDRNIETHDRYFWNLSTREWEHVYGRGNGVGIAETEKPVGRVAFSRDGKHVAMAEVAGNVRLYDVNYGLGNRFCWTHDDLQEATWVAFAPDGRKLLSCGRDDTIRLWDVQSGEPLSKITGSIQGDDLEPIIQITDDDKRRAEADMEKFDRNKDGVIHPTERTGLNWRSSDFVRAYSDDRNISREEAILRWARFRHDALGATKCFQAAVFSADGSRIISVTRDERIQIWDAESGELLSSANGTDKTVSSLALSQGGTTLATCGGEQVIKLWQIKE